MKRSDAEQLYQPVCRYCGEPIWWLYTPMNRRIPVNPPRPTTTRYDKSVHQAHQETCKGRRS